MTVVVVAIFVLSYALIATRRLRLLPIGRPAGALLGAVSMVAVGALTPEESFQAVDANTLVLLFAMMALAAYLERSGLFRRLHTVALRVCRTPAGLLTGLAIAPGVLSAFLLNDAVCLFLAPLVVTACHRAGLPMGPYLIALATSANIGSAATLVGNPQNIVIGSLSGIEFFPFFRSAGPASACGLLVNAGLIHFYYRRRLPTAFASIPHEAPSHDEWPRLTGIVTCAIVLGFFVGLHLAYATLAGVLILMLADRREPTQTFARVDWTLLVFFAALFVIVAGLAKTGLVEETWRAASGHLSLDHASGLTAFTALMAIGSNLFSNVPMVLLTGPHLTELGDPSRGWVLLAFTTTVAGNLTLVGSVANLIVAEQAKAHYDLGFFEYLKFGAVSTALVLATGVPLIVLAA